MANQSIEWFGFSRDKHPLRNTGPKSSCHSAAYITHARLADNERNYHWFRNRYMMRINVCLFGCVFGWVFWMVMGF